MQLLSVFLDITTMFNFWYRHNRWCQHKSRNVWRVYTLFGSWIFYNWGITTKLRHCGICVTDFLLEEGLRGLLLPLDLWNTSKRLIFIIIKQHDFKKNVMICHDMPLSRNCHTTYSHIDHMYTPNLLYFQFSVFPNIQKLCTEISTIWKYC